MYAAFSFLNSTVFAFFRTFNGRFCCIHQNHLIFHIVFQRRFSSRQRKRPVPDQRIFHPLDSSVDVAFCYSVAGCYMGICTVFPQIFQCSQQQILYAQLWRSPSTPMLFRISFSQNFYIFSNVACFTPVILRNFVFEYFFIFSYFMYLILSRYFIFARGLMILEVYFLQI